MAPNIYVTYTYIYFKDIREKKKTGAVNQLRRIVHSYGFFFSFFDKKKKRKKTSLEKIFLVPAYKKLKAIFSKIYGM